ncbi:DivIVA domain-containing protein [Maribellus maritimus]|uniref:DivIVA domain-containing protein n=1 Tax=Maribellus maritimus TaxID=2870838 RepID=UPI00293E47B4|nr:DivIVA domain-containing protein [Maribellus maritimus]
MNHLKTSTKTMTDKLQEITEKIYNEGIVKARDEAEKIKENAKKEAEKIINEAQKKAGEILAKAKSDADERKSNAESEMKLSARQFLSKLKQQVTNLILAQQVDSTVQETFSDKTFIQKIIITIIEKWQPAENGEMDLKIMVPQHELNGLTAILNQRAAEAMKKGLDVQVDSKLKTGFKIGPKDDRFVVRFTDLDFENYFKTYLKETTQKLLFED